MHRLFSVYKCYAEVWVWENMADRERQIMHAITDMWNLKQVTNRNRVEKSLPRARLGKRSGGNRERLVRVQTFSYKMKKVWGSNVKHGDCSWQQCFV